MSLLSFLVYLESYFCVSLPKARQFERESLKAIICELNFEIPPTNFRF